MLSIQKDLLQVSTVDRELVRDILLLILMVYMPCVLLMTYPSQGHLLALSHTQGNVNNHLLGMKAKKGRVETEIREIDALVAWEKPLPGRLTYTGKRIQSNINKNNTEKHSVPKWYPSGIRM